MGEFADKDGNLHGFVLNKGVFTTIDVPELGALQTTVNGINASGQLEGTYMDLDESGNPRFHASWGRRAILRILDSPGSIRSQGGFINAKGEVVGTYRDTNNTRHGFIWRKGTFTEFQVPNGGGQPFGTVAIGINDIGQVVGNYLDQGGDIHAFLRSSKGEITTFDVPVTDSKLADLTVAQGINNAGTIVGWYTS